jgi:hypothetical protein
VAEEGNQSADLTNNPAPEKRMPNQFDRGHALIIGIANYPKVSRLPQTVLDDATDVAALLAKADYCGYPKANIEVLLDGAAAADGIRQGFHKLANSAGSGDTVVVFFSGHGKHVKDGANAGSYLIPFDCDLGKLKKTAIGSEELTGLFSAIKAERLVVLLDACHSGGTGELKAIAPASELKAGLDAKTYNALAQGKGRVIMASSRVDEFSIVIQGMGNSLFTHYLMEGLRGAAPTRGDGNVCVFDLFQYISETVPKDAAQHPIFKAQDVENNFPLALYLGGKKEALGAPIVRPDRLSGKGKLEIIDRLVDGWQDLALYFEIPPKDSARFAKGEETSKILEWIESRNRVAELRDAFNFVGRDDLIEVLDRFPPMARR